MRLAEPRSATHRWFGAAFDTGTIEPGIHESQSSSRWIELPAGSDPPVLHSFLGPAGSARRPFSEQQSEMAQYQQRTLGFRPSLTERQGQAGTRLPNGDTAPDPDKMPMCIRMCRGRRMATSSSVWNRRRTQMRVYRRGKIRDGAAWDRTLLPRRSPPAPRAIREADSALR